MANSWLKQTPKDPLYPKLIWSRPEHKSQAGKVLIIGGSPSGFSATVDMYQQTQKAGAGAMRVLLPRSLEKIIGHLSGDIYFTPSNNSGSFSRQALGDFQEETNWSDSVLLSGEVGLNSETISTFEQYIDKLDKPVVAVNDAADTIIDLAKKYLNKNRLVLVMEHNQLQKLASVLKSPRSITSNLELVHLISVVEDLSLMIKSTLITKKNDSYIVARQGMVCETKFETDLSRWQSSVAASSAVWLAQNSQSIFESTCCSVVCAKD